MNTDHHSNTIQLLLTFCLLILLCGVAVSQESATPEQEIGEIIAYVIPIEKEIFKGMIHPIRRGIEEAENQGARVIIFELETPGGAVDTALELKSLIIDAVKERGMETAAFVNRHAISAGALLALSTQKIYMREGSTIGGAAPIMATGGEMGETTEEKMVSIVASEFRAAAQVNGHDPLLAAAMVDRDIEIPGIIEKGKLLSLDAQRAVDLGLARALAESVEDVLKHLGYEQFQINRFQRNWAETVALFITNPIVAGILLMIAIGGIYVEVRTPGFGIPGFLGITAFALVFWGHHIAGLAGMEVLLLFLVGLLLLGFELFVTPGFGLAGTAGILCILASFIFMLSERLPTSDFFSLDDLVRPLTILGSSVVGAGVLSMVALAFLPSTRMFRNIMLEASTSREQGFVGTEEKPVQMVGQVGVTISELRPAGIARFGTDRLDVVTDGRFIEAGRPVKIVKVAGRQVIVKEVQS